MVKQVAESCDIEFVTEIDNVDGLLTKDNEMNLYRIVQESVNNIVKHSQAKNAEVILNRTENGLKLTVTDNGIGFSETEEDYLKFGTGLNGMTERAKMLDSNLIIKAIPGKGTELILELNLTLH